MRVYGQSLESTKSGDSMIARARFATARAAAQTIEQNRALDGRGSVVAFSDTIATQDHGGWLGRFDGMSQLELSFDDQDKVLWCYMNPPGRPSVTLQLARESRALQGSIQQLFHELSDDGTPPIRYMVWSSKLPGIFNLGGDLRLFAELIRRRDRERLFEYAGACVDVVYANAVNLDLPLITVSLVRGDALGGGFEAAISSNLVISERSAKFGLPEMLFNLFPGMGAYSLIARRIGSAQAERMILSGRIYSAEELFELGLVDVLADDGKGEDAVYEYVEQYGRRHSAHCAVYNVRKRVNPIQHEELIDIAKIWVDAALALDESDLRRMERLAAAQDRRITALGRNA
ncbi:MAG TPA: crotonase/enoyl-CoA hydratase family protein [Alphaproteobacteria bacterium]|nr:crotonase/enoyl-CoA hydratase family protein [Alphaproteobacteria bacterium]